MWKMSSCARTDSVSPSTLYVTMTLIAPMAQMSPQNVVSVCVIAILKDNKMGLERLPLFFVVAASEDEVNDKHTVVPV